MAITTQHGPIAAALSAAQRAGEGDQFKFRFAAGQQLVDQVQENRRIDDARDASLRSNQLGQQQLQLAAQEAGARERAQRFQQAIASQNYQNNVQQQMFENSQSQEVLELNQSRHSLSVDQAGESAKLAQDNLALKKRDADRRDRELGLEAQKLSQSGRPKLTSIEDLKRTADATGAMLKRSLEAGASPEELAVLEAGHKEVLMQMVNTVTAQRRAQEEAQRQQVQNNKVAIGIVDSAYEQESGDVQNRSESVREGLSAAGLLGMPLPVEVARLIIEEHINPVGFPEENGEELKATMFEMIAKDMGFGE